MIARIERYTYVGGMHMRIILLNTFILCWERRNGHQEVFQSTIPK